MEMRKKTVSESRTEQIQAVMPQHANGMGNLFGGQLAAWIDVVGGVVARRHANHNCVTASIDSLNFKKPVMVKEFVVLVGQVTYVGRTSMEVRVDTFIDHLDGSRTMVNRAYLTFVALDEYGKPTTVPQLELETDEERQEWEAGAKRADLRHKRRVEQY